ncbi:piwi-like protein 1 [Paramacrobiotus metropolitanus]|uniref:piwi-like protein 1 n=1 Tax=Paramacrobiotus metropolitanus TaxID=2943436 RepID=UPI0024461368|nr:piwi-like protein 1 [Paramacrobiotus metropolitanus]
MASRNAGRGIPPGVGRGLPVLTSEMSKLAVNVPEQRAPTGMGRGLIGVRPIVVPTTTSSAYGAVRRERGNFDMNRPTYRVPQRFLDFSRTLPESHPKVAAKHGSSGTSVKLLANYFSMLPAVQNDDDYTLLLFHVNFEPFVHSRAERSDLVARVPALRRLGYFFDGQANLFVASTRLPAKKLAKITLDYAENDKRELTFYPLAEIGGKEEKDVDFESVDLVNGVLNHIMTNILTQRGKTRIGDGFYDAKEAVTIEGLDRLSYKLSVWPGYVPLVMRYDGGLMVNVDLGTKFVRDKTALDYINMYAGSSQYGTKEMAEKVMSMLKGKVVVTDYNRRAYKIKEISYEKSVRDVFSRRATNIGANSKASVLESQCSIQEYFKMVYNKTIKNENQPLLMCVPLEPDHKPRRTEDGKEVLTPLVPELCLLSGLTDDIRSNFSYMSKCLDAVRREPGKRVAMVKEFANTFASASAEVDKPLEGWGMEMGRDLKEVPGRQLPLAVLETNGRKVTYSREEADWMKNIRNSRLDKPCDFKEWALVYQKTNAKEVWDFLKMVNQVSKPFGIVFQNPAEFVLQNPNPAGHKTELAKITSTCAMVLIFLPDNNKQRYDEIKNFLVCDKGVASQCILMKTAQKTNMSIATKVVLQMNAKTGNPLWHIQNPSVKIRDAMIIGIAEIRGFMGFVATVDRGYSQFAGDATNLIKGGMRGTLSEIFSTAVSEYRDVNNVNPAVIILYRLLDGDDELHKITAGKDPEIKCVEAILQDLRIEAKLLYCVAFKRCKTRFFSEKGSGCGNPEPGTVIDTTVTIPGRYDFFLISHSGRKGTVMPTYYFVVSDQTKITADEFQNFTFQMAHMYYNWSGTIKVPAVCQYAMKMATMCAEVTKKQPNQNLRHKMWYL